MSAGRRTRLLFVTGTAVVAGAAAAVRARSAALDVAGKNVVVTGGTRGLGFVLARMLLAAGANVTICGRSQTTLDAAVAQLAGSGGTLQAVVCDVRDRASCERLIRSAVERSGPIDVLVNNAGVIAVGPLAQATLEDFHEAMDTHFWGPLYLMLLVLPGMRARRRGHIVNVSSVGGVVGVPHLVPYTASKFAQLGMTQAVAAETAADGVSVTAVVPGLMITGSPRNATFKGDHRAEYTWFVLSDSNPLIAVPVDTAARRILRAIRRREPQVTIGWTARMAEIVNAVLPRTTSRLLALAARLLPRPGAIGAERRTGAQSATPLTESLLTAPTASAAQRTNQWPPESKLE